MVGNRRPWMGSCRCVLTAPIPFLCAVIPLMSARPRSTRPREYGTPWSRRPRRPVRAPRSPSGRRPPHAHRMEARRREGSFPSRLCQREALCGGRSAGAKVEPLVQIDTPRFRRSAVVSHRPRVVLTLFAAIAGLCVLAGPLSAGAAIARPTNLRPVQSKADCAAALSLMAVVCGTCGDRRHSSTDLGRIGQKRNRIQGVRARCRRPDTLGDVNGAVLLGQATVGGLRQPLLRGRGVRREPDLRARAHTTAMRRARRPSRVPLSPATRSHKSPGRRRRGSRATG